MPHPCPLDTVAPGLRAGGLVNGPPPASRGRNGPMTALSPSAAAVCWGRPPVRATMIARTWPIRTVSVRIGHILVIMGRPRERVIGRDRAWACSSLLRELRPNRVAVTPLRRGLSRRLPRPSGNRVVRISRAGAPRVGCGGLVVVVADVTPNRVGLRCLSRDMSVRCLRRPARPGAAGLIRSLTASSRWRVPSQPCRALRPDRTHVPPVEGERDAHARRARRRRHRGRHP